MEDSKQKKLVVALGHSALGYDTNQQLEAVRKTARFLADLIESGCQLTITHSNGPQVSMIHKAMTDPHRLLRGSHVRLLCNEPGLCRI